MNQPNKKLLILDLDETLIHATSTPLNLKPDFVFDQYQVYKRPYLMKFIESASNDFDLAIWSSATDVYVQTIVELLELEHIDFKFIWGRSKCTIKRNLELDRYVYEKRLKKVKKLGYSLEHILIVDNSPEKISENYGNAIYIQSFEGNPNDQELQKLLSYLQMIKHVKNVRSIEKRGWSK